MNAITNATNRIRVWWWATMARASRWEDQLETEEPDDENGDQ